MIKVSKLTDYAVIVLGKMAEGEGSLCTASGLADKTGVPEPTVSKVLKLLAKGGLIASTRGINGGYRIVKEPAFMTMGDVVKALEGPVHLTSCVDGSHECCSLSHSCSMKGKWNPLNAAMKTALESVTLAQMIGKP